MRTTRFRHALAVVTAAAVLASMTAATVASPASAAKPRCQGKVATIVGTGKADVIRGTARRDIIVAKGGNDRIYGRGGNDLICAGGGNDLVVGGPGADTLWGQLGNDRLNGGPGPDFLAGQVGDDTLNGGISVDTCYQGTGVGIVSNCELPAPPPPPPPILVVAYTDANQNHVYDAGDVMISEIVDTNRDGAISSGDTINMGQYPTRLDAVVPARIRNTTEPWTVRSHTVSGGDADAVQHRVVVSDGVYLHGWSRTESGLNDQYVEQGPGGTTTILDNPGAAAIDTINLQGSVSQPMDAPLTVNAPGTADDGFIDVDIYTNN